MSEGIRDHLRLVETDGWADDTEASLALPDNARNVLTGGAMPTKEQTIANFAAAAIDNINQHRSRFIADHLQALLDGDAAGVEHLQDAYPLADSEYVKTLAFWSQADLLALADVRMTVARCGLTFGPDPKEVAVEKAEQAMRALVRVACRMDDVNAATVGDVDWFGDQP